ncbi:rho GTPase-activating protein 1-like [Mangifera indica]|uniref:rho GTPase-activating protein 1-like n=1 Tax=Mangifera indica TaxID=29780 RepID=UPI001CFADF3E|nr:rho GTPase-activating protein 1-like [Mangifera indica]
MTEVLHFPSSSTTSSPSSSSSSSPSPSLFTCAPPPCLSCAPHSLLLRNADGNNSVVTQVVEIEDDDGKDREPSDQLSVLTLLVTIFRKSLVACKTERRDLCAMEISHPTNVRHVAHVTFDRFHGFLGLPVEFEPEVPRRPPSASATVFGVSTESMQLSYDSRGNSVPTILLLMQRHLYNRGGLELEGIFRINAENSQEEYVRDQLNSGVVPDAVDVHCLAGLIKAWFRELPIGVLDSLLAEQVMRCQTEEDCTELVRVLPPTEAALLDWAINLMADVAQLEHLNKMNARNIAMVFAPNMTQMADPLIALMYAVQVMNFLKTLILRTLRERGDSVVDQSQVSHLEPFDENGRQSPSEPCVQVAERNGEKINQAFVAEEPIMQDSADFGQKNEIIDGEDHSPITSVEKSTANSEQCHLTPVQVDTLTSETGVCEFIGKKAGLQAKTGKYMIGRSSNSNLKGGPRIFNRQHSVLHITGTAEKTKGIGNLSCIDSRTERIEAWR